MPCHMMNLTVSSERKNARWSKAVVQTSSANIFSKQCKRTNMVGIGHVQAMEINANINIVYLLVTR